MLKMAPYLVELHTAAFGHCQRLSTEKKLLPLEKTNAVLVGLFARPDAPDTDAMIEAGYELTYANETEETPNESRWYSDKITNIWTKPIAYA